MILNKQKLLINKSNYKITLDLTSIEHKSFINYIPESTHFGINYIISFMAMAAKSFYENSSNLKSIEHWVDTHAPYKFIFVDNDNFVIPLNRDYKPLGLVFTYTDDCMNKEYSKVFIHNKIPYDLVNMRACPYKELSIGTKKEIDFYMYNDESLPCKNKKSFKKYLNALCEVMQFDVIFE